MKAETGEVFFDCDELYGDRGWLYNPILTLTWNRAGLFQSSSGLIKSKESWAEFGYGEEEHTLEFSDADFVSKLKEILR